MNVVKIITNLLLLVVLASANTSFSAEHTKDLETVVKKNLEDGSAILLDVRETSEWDAGHLNKATSFPLSRLKAGEGLNNIPKDKIIYLHCHSGRRVLPAADLLKTAGFKDVRALPWGYPQLIDMKFQ